MLDEEEGGKRRKEGRGRWRAKEEGGPRRREVRGGTGGRRDEESCYLRTDICIEATNSVYLGHRLFSGLSHLPLSELSTKVPTGTTFGDRASAHLPIGEGIWIRL